MIFNAKPINDNFLYKKALPLCHKYLIKKSGVLPNVVLSGLKMILLKKIYLKDLLNFFCNIKLKI